ELDTSDVDSNEGIDSNIKVVYDIFNSDTRYILKGEDCLMERGLQRVTKSDRAKDRVNQVSNMKVVK
ncbi:MAG: hypothetical protein LQ347_005427, partial [Umbilicaria vellea]